MSVNYYARTPETPAGEEGLHIGQSCTGVEFLFHAHPTLELTTVEAWREYLTRGDITIVTENGTVLEFDEFWPDATRRPADLDQPWRMSTRFLGHPAGPRLWRDVKGHPMANYEFH